MTTDIEPIRGEIIDGWHIRVFPVGPSWQWRAKRGFRIVTSKKSWPTEFQAAESAKSWIKRGARD